MPAQIRNSNFLSWQYSFLLQNKSWRICRTHTHLNGFTAAEVLHLPLAPLLQWWRHCGRTIQHTPLPPDHRNGAKTRDANQLTSITSTVSRRRPAAPYICSCLHSLTENYPSSSHNEMMKDRQASRKAEEHETFPRGSVMWYQHKHLSHSQQIASCLVLMCDIYGR